MARQRYPVAMLLAGEHALQAEESVPAAASETKVAMLLAGEHALQDERPHNFPHFHQ